MQKEVIFMESNIKRPDWLNEQRIAELKKEIDNCPNAYTEDDVKQIGLDENCDLRRYNAYNAKQILTHYGII